MLMMPAATMDLIVSFLAHRDYREIHDLLHLAFNTSCDEPCPHRNFITLQARCAAVRIAEQEMR